MKKKTSLQDQIYSPLGRLMKGNSSKDSKLSQAPPQLQTMKSVQQLELEYALQISDLKQKNKLLKQQNEALQKKNEGFLKIKKTLSKKSFTGQNKLSKKQTIQDKESQQDDEFIDFKESQFFCNLSNHNKQVQDLKDQLQKYKQKCQIYEFRQKKNNKKQHIIHIKN